MTTSGDVAVATVTGLVDERFSGFGDVGPVKALVINVAGMTRMTSFGVRQWLRAFEALPKSISDRYLLGCQTFFVDQLNMVLNFGGGAQVLTVTAPYTCPSCGIESTESVDLIAEHAKITHGRAPDKSCSKCGLPLELDESPETYFGFAGKYMATKVRPDVAALLGSLGLYAARDAEKPPKVIKIVSGSVTYFRIIGIVGSMFRARPFLVGAEGEVVIDLAETERFDPMGQQEWRKLIKSLASQVTAVTLVDVSQGFLAMAPDTFSLAKNVHVSSILVPYRCVECGRQSQQSHSLLSTATIGNQVCTTCGGTTVNELPAKLVAPLQRAASTPPAASAKLIARRDDILSRALTDAKVAQAGDAASGPIEAADTILGNYRIVRKLSAGGMAEVFLANQIGIGGFEKPVALKRIQRKFLESRHLAIDMFLNEAKIAGRLTHPNIVQVLDVGEVGGALYLAMEYVRGKDLRDVAKMLQANGEMMPLAHACHVVREVALALHHAYWSSDMDGNRLSVVHRDVSPHNIILGFDGAVKLLDFGVASSSVTEQDEPMIVGKWQYMSPEHPSKQIDHRSDLFSLGVVLYLLCSGRMPFSGTKPAEIVNAVATGTYPRLTGVPPELAALVDSMLSPDPALRPQTGQAVATALAEILSKQRLECTASDIATFLAQLFVYELAVETSTRTEVDGDIVMDVTTIKLALGSAPQQAQGTPAAGMPVTVTPTGLMSVASDSAVSFTPITPQPPPSARATKLWVVGALTFVVVFAVLLLVRYL